MIMTPEDEAYRIITSIKSRLVTPVTDKQARQIALFIIEQKMDTCEGFLRDPSPLKVKREITKLAKVQESIFNKTYL